LLKKNAYRIHHHQRILLLGLDHLQHGGALAVEQDLLLGQFEPVTDPGDGTQPYLRPGASTYYNQIRQFFGGAPQIREPDQHIPVTGLQGAGRQIDTLPGHGIGDVGHAESVLAQRPGRYLDAQLMIGEAVDIHLGDLGQLLQLLFDLLSIGLEIAVGHRAGYGDGHHIVGAPQFLDHRRFDLFREVVDCIDLGIDIIQKAREISPLFQFHRGPGHPLARFAAHLGNVVDAVDGILQALADGLFHILGAGTGIGHADLQLLGCKVGKGLTLQIGQAKQAEGCQKQHQQISHGGMAGEETDHGRWLPAADAFSCCRVLSSSLGFSSIPSTAGMRSETTSRSPGCSPSRMTR